MTEPRSEVARVIGNLPGIHINGLVRELDLAPGQVQDHVRQLLLEDVIVSDALHGRTHSFSPEFDAFERGVIALSPGNGA